MTLGLTGLGTAAEIRIGAGAAPSESIFKKITQPLAKSKNITIRLTSSGPLQAWKDLDAGKVDAAAAGLSIQDWTALMEADGYKVDPTKYLAQIIGVDAIKIFTNKDITIQALTKGQVKDIFSGTITNWKEVGGPDLPIVVVLGTKIQGTLSEFKKRVLGEDDYSASAVLVETAPDIKQRVVETPGAIGIGSKAQIDDLINAPRYPEPVRPITLLAKRENRSDDINTIVRFILGEGKQYIK